MGKAVKSKCVQCGEGKKSIGSIESVALFVCLNPKCPNFSLVQIGLRED